MTSPAELLPERVIVTSGLSKNLALGGYRIGFTRLPTGSVGNGVLPELVGVASEVWSCLASPMQHVAAAALAEPPAVIERIAASRRLHGAVTARAHELLLAAGATCRPHAGAFYLYPDFAPLRDNLAGLGVRTGQELADLLLERYGVGVLAGVEFGDDAAALRFRLATSLLYGEDDEQKLASLRSERPTALPWVAAAFDHLSDALAGLAATARPARTRRSAPGLPSPPG